MSGLFGASTTATQQKPNLFGSLNTNTGGNQPQAPGGLFGSTLGANNAPQPQQAGGLFGASQNAPAQPQLQQQQQQGGGLFGSTLNAPQQQQGGGLFGSTMNASQQQPRLGGSVWQGGSTMRSGGSLFLVIANLSMLISIQGRDPLSSRCKPCSTNGIRNPPTALSRTTSIILLILSMFRTTVQMEMKTLRSGKKHCRSALQKAPFLCWLEDL